MLWAMLECRPPSTEARLFADAAKSIDTPTFYTKPTKSAAVSTAKRADTLNESAGVRSAEPPTYPHPRKTDYSTQTAASLD